MKHEKIVILNNIRSAENVGAILRTADGAGVKKVYLIGHTPLPIDRFGRPNKKIAKTALGAEKFINWKYQKTTLPLLGKLKKEGYFIFAVEQDLKSRDFRKVKLRKKNVFIFGSEVGGIPKSILAKSDEIIEIPMQGKKESLNVSVAFGIILFLMA